MCLVSWQFGFPPQNLLSLTLIPIVSPDNGEIFYTNDHVLIPQKKYTWGIFTIVPPPQVLLSGFIYKTLVSLRLSWKFWSYFSDFGLIFPIYQVNWLFLMGSVYMSNRLFVWRVICPKSRLSEGFQPRKETTQLNL